MANVVSVQELNNGARNYVISVSIQGDGSGEETAYPLVDVSTLTGVDTVSIWRVMANVTGFQATLEWGGATIVPCFEARDGDGTDSYFGNFGGLQNPKVANYNGDLVMTTIGLGAGDEGTFVIECKKKYT